MTLLAISPDFASHYLPISIVARAAREEGHRVVVATGPTMRHHVETDGFEWRELRLGAGSNTGIVERTPAIDRFLAATQRDPIETLRLQARDRAEDLLWQPVAVARRIAELCDVLLPEQVIVDHESFGSTLAMHATGRPFVSLVPGHPSQLPIGDERYGVPSRWPAAFDPGAGELDELHDLVDTVGRRFTDRWNTVLAEVAPHAELVDDAFRVHGEHVLYNSPLELQPADRQALVTAGHRFVGPLVRREALPAEFERWARPDGTPRVYVAFGTFLSHRHDVLERVASALRRCDVRAAIATGPTAAGVLGPIPEDWIVAPTLPQVALLAHADLAIHHGGNNSVQESLAAGARQLVLPFSTDQFANAFDLERTGLAAVAAPNTTSADELAGLVDRLLADRPPTAVSAPAPSTLTAALRLAEPASSARP